MTRLEVGSKPIGVVTDEGSRAFVASMGSNHVTVIDLEHLQVTDTIRVGRGPDGMAFVPAE